MTPEEEDFQREKYAEIYQRKEDIKHDISTIELTIKQLVAQQLGDKSGYDSTVGDDIVNNQALNASGDKPLESLIKEALNYDSTVYKQALGVEGYDDQNSPNGVIKSQELSRERQQMYR